MPKKRMNQPRVSSDFDPAQLDDPIAMRTGWTADSKTKGASFKTHRLVTVNSNRIEFHATRGAKLFCVVFIVAGIGGCLSYFFIEDFTSESIIALAFSMIPIVTGIVFLSLGTRFFYLMTSPIVFDRQKGCFWKGRKDPDQVLDRTSLKVFAKFEEIHAFQLLTERHTGNEGGYYSFELNLVLINGKRINVIDHGNKESIREDAIVLSAFMDKPVWDAM